MSTKSRRPGAVVVTPPPTSKERKRYTAAEKQTLLDNFDLEVADKTRAFRASLAATLASFVMRQETEILKIPRDLRTMTVEELGPKYGGSWSGTLQKIARDKIVEREKEEEKERARKEEEAVKGKRKRATTGNTSDSSPGRTNKNARRDAPGSSSKRAPARKTTAKTPRSKPSSASSGPSSLPQNHVFNPALPPTPSFARAARRNESFFSANGSPIAVPGASEGDDDNDHDHENDREDVDSDDSDELPDPDAYEAKLQARAAASAASAAAAGSPKSNPSRPSAKSQPSNPSRKPKRAPSLMFRKSLAPGHLPVPPPRGGKENEAEGVLSSIDLGDGRTVSFNPYQLSPGRIRDEMEQGGIGKAEQEVFIAKIRDETVRVLSERMSKWNVF